MFAQAQTPVVFEEWAESKGVQEFFYKNVTVTDVSNNVYVAGATLNGDGNYDLLISKFDKYGVHLWSDTVAGAGGGHDMAAAIAIDAEGDVLVCGTISAGGSEGNNMLLVKYDTDGFEYWRYSYDNGGNDDAAVALCFDGDNDIYLTGATYNSTSLSDMLTIKVDSYGNLVWDETYDYNSLYDLGVKIGLSGSRVIVTGGAQHNFNSFAIVALSYTQSDGSLSGSAISGGTQQTMEEVSDLFVDENDNIYIAGSSVNPGYGYDFKLIKLDEDLEEVWVKTWDGEGLNDYARGVKVAPNGDVYVCGTTATTGDGDDMVLLKYSSGGNLYWAKTYNGNYRGDDRAETLEYHLDGYIYVAGSSYVVSNMDYLTLKYDTSGELLWEINYNSPHNKNDRATNMAIDSDGDIIVTGQCERDSVLKTYYAVKYVEKEISDYIFDSTPAQNGFIQNVGQLFSSNDSVVNNIKFYSKRAKHSLFLHDDRLSYLLNKPIEDSVAVDSIKRVDVQFVSSLQSSKVRALNPLSFYHNYFYPHCDEGIARVPVYSTCYYDQIWDKINLIISQSNVVSQFIFELAPNAKISDLKLDFQGAEEILIDSITGDLKVITLIGNIILPKIQAFQPDNYNSLVELNWQPNYSVLNETVSITNIGNHDLTRNLVFIIGNSTTFDPTSSLCWSTFLGGDLSDSGTGIDFYQDEFAICGSSLSNLDFPNTIFDYQISTGTEGFVSKFDTDGKLLFSLFYGGWAHDHFFDLSFDSQGDIYVVGYTGSNDIPKENPGNGSYYDGSHGSQSQTNGFIAKLTNNGEDLLWGTYFGASFRQDRMSSIYIDGNDQKYIVGYGSNADSDFPLEAGSNANTYFSDNTSNTSGFIAKFDQNNSLVWSTMFGGSSLDFITDLTILSDGRLGILGGTLSSNLPVVNGGNSNSLYNSTLSGDSDHFLAIFSPIGELLHCTYIGGTGSEIFFSEPTHGNRLVSDSNDNLFLGGFRATTGMDFQEYGNYYFNDDVTSNKSFIYMINSSDYTLTYGTCLFEGDNQTILYGIGIDDYDNLMLVGSTRDNAIPFQGLNDEYFQNILNPGAPLGYYTDGFILIQNAVDGIIYCTNIGGSYDDFVKGVAMYQGSLYLTGYTNSDIVLSSDVSFPLYDPEGEAYFQANIAGDINQWDRFEYDCFITKFCFDYTLNVENIVAGNQGTVNVYPNPSRDGIRIELSKEQGGFIERVQIYNLLGGLIYSEQMTNYSISCDIDVSRISSGQYILSVMSASEQIFHVKFVVIH
jgi:hypothetical protein